MTEIDRLTPLLRWEGDLTEIKPVVCKELHTTLTCTKPILVQRHTPRESMMAEAQSQRLEATNGIRFEEIITKKVGLFYLRIDRSFTDAY